MKKRFYKAIKIFAVILILAILTIKVLIWQEHRAYEQQGAVLVARVERFRAQYARFPRTVSELELEEPITRGPYYTLQDSTTYEVFSLLGLTGDTFILLAPKSGQIRRKPQSCYSFGFWVRGA